MAGSPCAHGSCDGMDSTLSGIAIVSVGTLPAALPLGGARRLRNASVACSPSIGEMVVPALAAAPVESMVTARVPCSGTRTCVASRRASRNSAALVKRWPGSSLRARDTTASNTGGRCASAIVLGRRRLPVSASATVSASALLYGSRPTSMR